jgi:hypothetical protein
MKGRKGPRGTHRLFGQASGSVRCRKSAWGPERLNGFIGLHRECSIRLPIGAVPCFAIIMIRIPSQCRYETYDNQKS